MIQLNLINQSNLSSNNLLNLPMDFNLDDIELNTVFETLFNNANSNIDLNIESNTNSNTDSNFNSNANSNFDDIV